MIAHVSCLLAFRHPDRNQDNKEESERRFKEISEAYNLLTTQKGGNGFNQYARQGFHGQQGFHPGGAEFNPHDLFRQMFRDQVGAHFVDLCL